MNKKSLGLVVLFSLALFVAVPAFAQLGGALGGTLGTGARATGNGGGMRGDLGLDQTLNQTTNGSVVRGGRGIGLDQASSIDSAADISPQDANKNSVKGSTEKSGAELKSASNAAVKTGTEVSSASAAKVQPAGGNATDTLQSAQLSSSSQGSLVGRASGNDASSSSGVSSSNRASAGGKHVSSDANTNADLKASGKRDPEDSGPKASASNSNSGSAKLHGIDRAESRVKNDTALDAIDNNEQRRATVDSSSQTQASAKAKRHGK